MSWPPVKLPLEMPFEACASSQPHCLASSVPPSITVCGVLHRAMVLPPAAAGLCTILMVFGMSVEDVLCSSEWATSPRNLECVEIFAGVGAVASAAWELNLRAATYDKSRIPGSTEATEDITTQQGFRTAVSLVMRLVPTGLLWLAPVCASWGYMNRSRCKRRKSNGYEGDLSYAPVVEGNAMVKITVFLILLAACRGIRAAMENPVNSAMFRYHLVTKVETALAMTSAIAYRCTYESAAYGRRYLKGYRMLAIGTWIRGVAAQCRCPQGIHLPLVTKNIGPDGKVRITGIKKRLTESGAYPLALGRKIIACAAPGQPLQPSDFPDNGTGPAGRSAKRITKKPTRAGQVRTTVIKKQARKTEFATHGRSSVKRPVSSVFAPLWLQPSASAASTSRPSKRCRDANQLVWCRPAATSTSERLSSAAIAKPSWLTPQAEQ